MNKYYNSINSLHLLKFANLKKDVSIQTEDTINNNLDSIIDNCLHISLDDALNIFTRNDLLIENDFDEISMGSAGSNTENSQLSKQDISEV